jgi:hydroxymethylpyrimidine/phosphomethylpyrimidine kinase
MPPSVPPMVLSFAASDPTGGAGLQADLVTLAALGCHPLSVVTALTVQDTRGVAELLPVEPRWVTAQARGVLADLAPAAFKLGVLGSAANARAVREVLAAHSRVPVVVDPVLASGRGDPLADAASLMEAIVPAATVLTPNSIEARALAGDDDLARCARRLVEAGAKYVLITGTHERGDEVVNTLYDASGRVDEARWPRLAGSYHGSGCTLASALAAGLAKGADVPQAAREAQRYTWEALKRGFRPGSGQWLPKRI